MISSAVTMSRAGPSSIGADRRRGDDARILNPSLAALDPALRELEQLTHADVDGRTRPSSQDLRHHLRQHRIGEPRADVGQPVERALGSQQADLEAHVTGRRDRHRHCVGTAPGLLRQR